MKISREFCATGSFLVEDEFSTNFSQKIDQTSTSNAQFIKKIKFKSPSKFKLKSIEGFPPD